MRNQIASIGINQSEETYLLGSQELAQRWAPLNRGNKSEVIDKPQVYWLGFSLFSECSLFRPIGLTSWILCLWLRFTECVNQIIYSLFLLPKNVFFFSKYSSCSFSVFKIFEINLMLIVHLVIICLIHKVMEWKSTNWVRHAKCTWSSFCSVRFS